MLLVCLGFEKYLETQKVSVSILVFFVTNDTEDNYLRVETGHVIKQLICKLLIKENRSHDP